MTETSERNRKDLLAERIKEVEARLLRLGKTLDISQEQVRDLKSVPSALMNMLWSFPADTAATPLAT
mgnify:CR=1 FL=1